jgi:hypothetical protein
VTVWEVIVFGFVIARVVRYEAEVEAPRKSPTVRQQIASRRAARG